MKRLKQLKLEIEEAMNGKRPSFIRVEHWGQRDPYTYACLVYENGAHTLIGEGFAKRMSKDKPNMLFGYKIALGRAAKDLAREMDEFGYKTEDVWKETQNVESVRERYTLPLTDYTG